MSERLTGPQRELLQFYADAGPTAQSSARGTVNTWRALLRKGLVSRSHGLGTIETEITPAGRAALTPSLDAEGKQGDMASRAPRGSTAQEPKSDSAEGPR